MPASMIGSQPRRAGGASAAGLAAALIFAMVAAAPAAEPQIYLSSERNPIALTRDQIRATTESIEAVVYKFDEHSLEKAIKDALERGVSVRIVADASEARRGRSHLEDLQKKGAQIRLWRHGKLHAKLTILDGKRVVTGSFNWTESAQHGNMELIYVTERPEMVKRCREIFERLWDHSKPGKL